MLILHPVAVWLIIAVAYGVLMVLTERPRWTQPADRERWDTAGPSAG